MKIGKINIYLHPITVHFTSALYPVSFLFLVLHLTLHQASFGQTYFYILLLATLSSPFSYATGIVDWKERYKGAKTIVFTKKLRYGMVLMATGVICTAWYARF